MRAFTSVVKSASRAGSSRTNLHQKTRTSHLALSGDTSTLTSQSQLPSFKALLSRAYSTKKTVEPPRPEDEDSRKKDRENQTHDNSIPDAAFLSTRDFGRQKQKPQDCEGKGGEGGPKSGGEEEGKGSGFVGDAEFEFPGIDDFLPDDVDFF